MSKALIIGAGGVSSVVVHKCCMNPDVFEEICLASRTLSRCEAIKASVKNSRTVITTARLDADDTQQVIALIGEFKPDIVINVALPYQDLTIMDACLATGVDYLDTANYEPPEIPKFEYKWQWAYKERFEKAGITAVLGCGFDPGVTGVFSAYAMKHHFDEITSIDIVDANAGDHGYPFATNFNPEINIREITAKGRYYKDGGWIETEPLALSQTYDLDRIGPKKVYLLYHEELESLARNIRGVQQIRFWMTFSDNYINHLTVLQNVGMTSIEAIDFQGMKIAPLQFLKAVLPDPASLGSRTKGKTNIGCIFKGTKDGQEKTYYVYNICDHQECYAEVGSQAISYTTGVPAMIGAMMVLKGIWKKPGVNNVEEFDPDPFMAELDRQGLPWNEDFAPTLLEGM
ncbi:MAG: saccharopine dehydrogenase family protein [Saccharofermentanales bacterium]